jgi:hypothetical protein
MRWNYRIIYHDDHEHPYYGLHEVYYNQDGKIEVWTAEADIVSDVDKEDLINSLRLMLKDAEHKDVLFHSKLIKNIGLEK